MERALKFTEECIDIPTDDNAIIKHAQKSLLFNKSKSSMKKASWIFDVAKDALEGAEICKLVGNFLLYKLSEKYKRNNLTLYRDDRLTSFKNISGSVSEKKLNNIIINCLENMTLNLQLNAIEKSRISNMSLGIWKTHRTVLTWKTRTKWFMRTQNPITSAHNQTAAKIIRIKNIGVIG